jgi:hypothetical protein
MTVDAVTEHGTRYRLDFEDRFWARIKDGHWGSTERIWDFKVGTELNWPWDAPDSWISAKSPEIGKHLYIRGKDVWYVSTVVQRIIELPDWRAPLDFEPDAVLG